MGVIRPIAVDSVTAPDTPSVECADREPPAPSPSTRRPAIIRPPAASLRWWQGRWPVLSPPSPPWGRPARDRPPPRHHLPVVSVGEWVIDHVPVAVKDFAIRQFGTNDKPMLIAGTVVMLLSSP